MTRITGTFDRPQLKGVRIEMNNQEVQQFPGSVCNLDMACKEGESVLHVRLQVDFQVFEKRFHAEELIALFSKEMM